MGSLTPYNVLSSTRYSAAEVPAGVQNGVNTIFTLTNPPSPSNGLQLYVNGIIQKQGAGEDYTLAGLTITMAVAPLAADEQLAYYFF